MLQARTNVRRSNMWRLMPAHGSPKPRAVDESVDYTQRQPVGPVARAVGEPVALAQREPVAVADDRGAVPRRPERCRLLQGDFRMVRSNVSGGRVRNGGGHRPNMHVFYQ